jgi:hypothetical protein
MILICDFSWTLRKGTKKKEGGDLLDVYSHSEHLANILFPERSLAA